MQILNNFYNYLRVILDEIQPHQADTVLEYDQQDKDRSQLRIEASQSSPRLRLPRHFPAGIPVYCLRPNCFLHPLKCRLPFLDGRSLRTLKEAKTSRKQLPLRFENRSLLLNLHDQVHQPAHQSKEILQGC